MAEKDGEHKESGQVLHPTWARRAAKRAARRAELQNIAPILMSLPWRRINAGYTRVRDMATFIKFYEMYAPLLAGYKDILIEARDSGLYKWFDLHASVQSLEVAGIDEDGHRKVLFEIRKDYWEGEHPPAGPFFTPL
jgi:hypothetical protein